MIKVEKKLGGVEYIKDLIVGHVGTKNNVKVKKGADNEKHAK